MIVIWVILSLNFFNILSAANQFIIVILQESAVFLLKLMSFSVFIHQNSFGIEGSSGVVLGPPCNGFNLMYIYAAFLLSIPGKLVIKLYWILTGMVIIQILNLVRILSLVYLSAYHPDLMSFNHDYTFTLIMYSCCFLSWYLFVKKNPV